MGHAVEIGVVNKRKEIIPFAEEFAYYNGDRQEGSDRYCPSQMTIKDIYFDSFEEAEKYLDRFTGNYDDRAVQFKDWELKKKTKTQENLEKKIPELANQIVELGKPTTKSMTCPICGKRTPLRFTYRCQHCHKDITPKTKADKIAKLNVKFDETKAKIEELEIKRRTSKFTFKWAVKVEVHC